ncbi:hypothetical protein R6L23_36095 [Streptomyces sp. SR27]|uniref:hypothetical protein n=1 Tax=Streptomyces sp. SR27 TaxID=3076630 RepID=UPI00295AF18F|nr:hypothetical protein [Streptomyces sp. SR27]MDV9193570.1 hypothetical protein [Streptomyces sp. SR27]
MSISWRSSAAAFEQILGRHGVAAGACTMEAAWAAFGEFVQVPVEGIEGPEDGGDAFIVGWGVWDWTGNRPALSLGRLLTVNEYGDRQDPYWQPLYWKVEFQACFAEDPAWADLHISGGGDTGFVDAAIGKPRADALAATRRFIDEDPLLSALWRSAPIEIDVTLERAG